MARSQHDPATLPTAHLWHGVLLARGALDRARDRQSLRNDTRGEIMLARSDLLCALEAYVARLTSEGTPVPYRLRDEIRLHAGLVAAQRR